MCGWAGGGLDIYYRKKLVPKNKNRGQEFGAGVFRTLPPAHPPTFPNTFLEKCPQF